MKQAVFLVLWLSVATAFPAKAQTVSNEAIIDSLFFKALDSLKVDRYLDSTGVQIIVSSLNPEKQAFCRSALIRYFNRKAIPVFQVSKKAKLALEVFEPKVEYLEPVNEILGFGGSIKRRIGLKLQGWIAPADSNRGNVAFEMQLSHRDTVKKNAIGRLEESPFLFCRGKWVSYSRWTRYLQPAIILGSVSLLVYLFFSLRS